MNLLYFTTAYERGLFGNRVHEEFLSHLIVLGHTAVVLAPDPKQRGHARTQLEPGTPAEPVVARLPVSALRRQRLANRLSARVLHYDFFLSALAGYRAFLRRNPQIDLVHVESIYPLGAVAALAGDRRPFIPTIRGGDLIADDSIAYGFARFRSVRWLLRQTFARATFVRAVSPGARQMALQYGCPPEKIVIVPRNIREDCFVHDPPVFRAERRQLIEQRHGLAGRKIIVAAGRLLPVKGFDDLIRAMPLLLQRIPEASVLICGPNRDDVRLGDYAAYLRGLMAEHGVEPYIQLVGHVPPAQMADYLAAADAVAVPSLIEGGNKILVEGAILGTPFVATETSGTVGFFNAAEGLSIPVRDPQQLATALAELLSDQDAWQQRSTACAAGRDRFRVATVTDAMVHLYQRAHNKSQDAAVASLAEHSPRR